MNARNGSIIFGAVKILKAFLNNFIIQMPANDTDTNCVENGFTKWSKNNISVIYCANWK